MKYLLCIVIFCTSGLLAQVNPPDLRCLEVTANGNIKLTWIPPADPGSFDSYEIHTSVFKTGPYTSVTNTLTTITTNTFLHVTGTGIIQTSFYFIKMKYGSGGNSSINSDTLNTIFLTSFSNPIIGTQDIQYTNIHSPKLNTSASTFTLDKEYPLGTWSILSISSNTVYPDTIMVCGAKMNYAVSLADNSGCRSISNILMADYKDIRNPEQPYVDSISVLPNGTTVIGWKIPVDRDIERYYIQYAVGGTNQLIDSLMGRENTHYTYTTPTANSGPLGVFVQALDTCRNGSTVNYMIRTMFVRSTYDRCAYQTTLKWNKYVWSDVKGVPVETLGKYKIYYSVNGSAFTSVGETSDTNFVHTGVAPGKNICYFIRVVNQKQTITASSNRTCFFSDQVEAPQFIYIKTATVIDKSSAEIKIYLDNSKSSRGISVERSANGTDYTAIGFLPYTGAAHYSLVDENIEPGSRSYLYKAYVIDSCGNTRFASIAAKTILLKVHEDEGQMFVKQLSWSKYEGFAGSVSGYNVYRIVNGDMNTALIGSTDALNTTYTDNAEEAAPMGAKIEYLVQAVEGIGNPYGILERSNSNPVPVYMEGNLYVPNAFAPSGLNTTWLPITHFIEKTDYHVSVFNRWGKKVFETNDDTVAWDGSDCIADVYVYLIDYKNARGEYLQVKGTVILLR